MAVLVDVTSVGLTISLGAAEVIATFGTPATVYATGVQIDIALAGLVEWSTVDDREGSIWAAVPAGPTGAWAPVVDSADGGWADIPTY